MNVVSFSGGKDSMYTLWYMRKNKIPVDHVVFADTRIELPGMIAYIKYAERKCEIKIDVVKSDKTFFSEFYRTRTKGPLKGKISGWPYTGGCWWNETGKITPLNNYMNKLGDNVIQYIGISAEETDRYERLIKDNPCKVSPMYEKGVTGECAKCCMRQKGLLNPLYDEFHRLGCYLCPQQRISELRKLRHNYPKHWGVMLDLDDDSPVHFKPNGATVHDFESRFAFEDRQISIFDLIDVERN